MSVTPNMKISEVLKSYPQLLDVLVAQSPSFARLRNPVLRRVFPKLVTVAQAAVMGGLPPAALVRNLNAALGEADADVGPIQIDSMSGAPRPHWVDTAKIAATLDVRDAQRRKEEPFAAIMAAIAAVGLGEVFLLRNTFEPLPLYDVLGKRGYVPWARQLGPDDWEVYFFKSEEARAHNQHRIDSTRADVVTEPSVGASDEVTLTVDVRDLVPPQPMMRILDALERLRPGQTLLVHHVRRPVYLYPRLAEMGCEHETVELGPDRVDIRIRKA